jgi:adenosine deaminase
MRPNPKGLHHDHIDGSRALIGVIESLYKIRGKTFPFADAAAWVAYFRNPQENIVEKFASACEAMQTRESLFMGGYAYGAYRASEGYGYVEAKFAPAYHTRGGLTIKKAAAAMVEGLKSAEGNFGIKILPQLVINREADPEVGVEIAKIALEYDGAVALDMACDEAAHPPEKHRRAYELTFGSKVRRDCHAGEWVGREPRESYRARLLQNVRTAISDLKCHGLGHAIPLADDPDLVKRVVGEGIRIAGCPLSNFACGLIKDVRELKIDELLDAGVIYTLNADDDLFLPPMEMVVSYCDKVYDFSAEQCRKLEENVFKGAFR